MIEKRAIPPRRTWTALLVDDEDADILWVEQALDWVVFSGRAFRLIRATSATDALRMYDQLGDVRVVITDLIMETPDAGVRLVNALAERRRNEGRADDDFVAVIMTSQPELVPPGAMDAMAISSVYDKNDQSSTKFRAHLSAALARLR